MRTCSFWPLFAHSLIFVAERGFEDHESLVELLSVWTRHNENKIYFVSRPQKYVMFTEPQVSRSSIYFSVQVGLSGLTPVN